MCVMTLPIGEVVYVLPKEGPSPNCVLGRLAQVRACGHLLPAKCQHTIGCLPCRGLWGGPEPYRKVMTSVAGSKE